MHPTSARLLLLTLQALSPHLAHGKSTSLVTTEPACPRLTSSNPLILPPQICPVSTTPANSSHSAPDPPTAQTQTWQRGDKCHNLGPSTYCPLTSPSFAANQGLSLITTPQRLESLTPKLTSAAAAAQAQAARTPWGTKKQDPASPNAPPPPYRQEHIPGKGEGLVAARRIAAGELILSRTPAVMVDEGAFEGFGQEALRELLVQGVGMLPERHRGDYLGLTTHDEVESEEERVYQVFAKNNFRTRIDDEASFHAIFVDVSRLNHACRPSCAYHFDNGTLSQKVFAARDIMPGEELTVSYIDPIQTRADRQSQLHSSWGFHCTCDLCSADEEKVTQSDDRVRRINDLWKILDDYSPSPRDAATPEDAEELLRLYEAEQLKTRVHEAYYRAALEYNGAGDAKNAVRYAMLSIIRGQVMKGPERPFLTSMRELAKSPEAHWSWEFRHPEQEIVKDEL